MEKFFKVHISQKEETTQMSIKLEWIDRFHASYNVLCFKAHFAKSFTSNWIPLLFHLGKGNVSWNV